MNPPEHQAPSPVDGSPLGLGAWLRTHDHRHVGIMYLASVVFFFMVAGLLALALRFELFSPAADLLSPRGYQQLYSMHGVVMVFLVLSPAIVAALGNVMLPSLIGAARVAFPRANLFAFYVHTIGAVALTLPACVGMLEMPFSMLPTGDSTPVVRSPMWAALGLLAAAAWINAANLLATVHRHRAPTMAWTRLPVFVWSVYATALAQFLLIPAAGVVLFFAASHVPLPSDSGTWLAEWAPRVGGLYLRAALAVAILPGFGLVAELLRAHAKRPLFAHLGQVVAVLTMAWLALLVASVGAFEPWSTHLFPLASAFGLLATLPPWFLLVAWAVAIHRGIARRGPGLWYACSASLCFAMGTLSSAFLATLSLGDYLADTTFALAHQHYLMLGGTLMAFLGGVTHWWPRITGRQYREPVATCACLLVFVGFHLTFFSQFVLGARGMPRHLAGYADWSTRVLAAIEPWQRLSTVGAVLLAVGLFTVLGVLLHSLLREPAMEPPRSPS